MSIEIGAPKATDGVSCDTCVAACCRAGAGLQLTHDEVYRNKRTMDLFCAVKPRNYPQQFGTEIEDVDIAGRPYRKPVTMSLPALYGFYFLRTDCGNLTADNRCGVYGNHPKACRDYEVGSRACLAARAVCGLDGHEAVIELGRTEPINFRTTNPPRIS